ncbi:MAG: hypothetical protein GQ527_10600, partial [Bacteroidales bacterium]|nr:hypothetical protein [Bacteroidales bacterium]
MNIITNSALLKKIQVLESKISNLELENLDLKKSTSTDNGNHTNQIKAELSRFKTTMDSLDAIVYVSDMETYELLYLNKLGRELTGDLVGEKCYVALQQGQDSPCDFCTNHLLIDKDGKAKKPHVWEFQNTKTKRWYHLSD